MKSITYSSKRGFTLIELVVVLIVIAIITAVALPQYANFSTKAKLSTVLEEIAPLKTAVALCQQRTDSLDACDHGENQEDGIRVEAFEADGYNGNIDAITVADGVISVTLGNFNNPIDDAVVTYTPTVEGANLVWAVADGSPAISSADEPGPTARSFLGLGAGSTTGGSSTSGG